MFGNPEVGQVQALLPAERKKALHLGRAGQTGWTGQDVLKGGRDLLRKGGMHGYAAGRRRGVWRKVV